MAYVISDECIMCGACQSECPVEAISEGDGKYVIDPDKCIECGACAGTWPVGARPGCNGATKKNGLKGSFFLFLYLYILLFFEWRFSEHFREDGEGRPPPADRPVSQN